MENKEQPEYLGIICPHCGEQTGIDAALVEPDAPMIYCENCGGALFGNEEDDEL